MRYKRIYNFVWQYTHELFVLNRALARSVWEQAGDKQSMQRHFQAKHESKVVSIKPLIENSYPAQTHSNNLKILSWNMFKGYHKEVLESSLDRLVNQHVPDIITLQEVPSFTHRLGLSYNSKEFENLAYAPMHSVDATVYSRPYDHIGQATLSKKGHAKSDHIILPQSIHHSLLSDYYDSYQRGVLYTQHILPRDKTLGVYNVHLENMAMPQGRLRQIVSLCKAVEQRADDGVILIGDFNPLMGKRLEKIFSYLEAQKFKNILPSRYEQRIFSLNLDHVFVRGNIEASAKQVAGKGSDHDAIVVKVETV